MGEIKSKNKCFLMYIEEREREREREREANCNSIKKVKNMI